MQARPEKAKRYGLKAIERGACGRHRHDCDPPVLSAMPDGEGQAVRLFVSARARPARPRRQIIDRRRPAKLDLAVLRELPSKTIILGVIDLSTTAI